MREVAIGLWASVWLSILAPGVAYSQGVVLRSRFVEGELPMDPEAEQWESATPLVIPLSSQVNFKPRIYDASASSLTVRSLNNGNEAVFLLEWGDGTANRSSLRAGEFADAAAIEHPIDAEDDSWFAMGMPESPVNIWYWNAAWEEDLKGEHGAEFGSRGAGWDDYRFETEDLFYTGRVGNGFWSVGERKTPVEDLDAARMQSLTSQPLSGQNVRGRGVWRDGRWRVVFAREFSSDDAGDAQFQSSEEAQKLRPIAFAIWDGSNGESGSRKAVSAFYFVDLSGVASSGSNAWAWTALLAAAAAEGLAMGWLRHRGTAQTDSEAIS